MESPYHGLPPEKWLAVTKNLIDQHPLKPAEIVEVVRVTWDSIFKSSLGASGFHIGNDIFPKPQIMGFFLHELIPLELAARYPGIWRGEKTASEKDLVYIPENKFSVEIKTSSNPKFIYGNRSFAQATTKGKKAKAGYYIGVNFQKFEDSKHSRIVRVRFGWLDSTDWTGQAAATGQQSSLRPEIYRYKLLEFYIAD